MNQQGRRTVLVAGLPAWVWGVLVWPAAWLWIWVAGIASQFLVYPWVGGGQAPFVMYCAASLPSAAAALAGVAFIARGAAGSGVGVIVSAALLLPACWLLIALWAIT